MSQADLPPQPTAPPRDSAGLKVVIRPETFPADVLRLRERVFRDEARLLADADLASKDDEIGTHVCLYRHDILVGAVLGVPAEQSSFPERTGVPTDQLTDLYYG